jgi:ribosomal protein S26
VGVTGPPAKAKMIVDIPCETNCDGKNSKFVLKDVEFVPESFYNLFSLTKLMSNRWTMSGDKAEGIKMCQNGQTLHFNKTVRTPKGILYVLILKRRLVELRASKAEEHEVSLIEQELMRKEEVAAATSGVAITINKAHAMCGPMNQVETRVICDYYGQDITKQGFQQCASCGRAKAKQLAVAKVNETHVIAGSEGHRLFMDISSVKNGKEKKKALSKPYWLLFVVEQTSFKISEFLKTKGEMPVVACETIWKIKQKGVNVKHIRLDNMGENKAFAELANSSKWNLQLVFEFTGAMTPQRNYLVEIGFATLCGCL